MSTTPADHPHWVKFFVDGGTFMASRHRGSRRTRGVYWSMLCVDPTKTEEQQALLRKQDTQYKTNNDAEWLAVREALQYAAEHVSATPIIIYSDSKLVVNQFNGEWRAKIARHHRLRTECRLLAEKLKFVVLQWVPREVSVEKLGH